eukprot:357832-Chlamydomonas_euryale.AAC.12
MGRGADGGVKRGAAVDILQSAASETEEGTLSVMLQEVSEAKQLCGQGSSCSGSSSSSCSSSCSSGGGSSSSGSGGSGSGGSGSSSSSSSSSSSRSDSSNRHVKAFCTPGIIEERCVQVGMLLKHMVEAREAVAHKLHVCERVQAAVLARMLLRQLTHMQRQTDQQRYHRGQVAR